MNNNDNGDDNFLMGLQRELITKNINDEEKMSSLVNFR